METVRRVDYSQDESGLSYPSFIEEEQVASPERRSQILTPEEARSRFSFQMPLWAGTSDTLLPSDDPSYYTYQGVNGIYHVPSFYSYEDRLETPRTLSEGWQNLQDKLPSRTEVESALLGLPSHVYGVADRLVSGEGTLGDVWEAATIPALGAAAMPRTAAQAPRVLSGEVLPPEPRLPPPNRRRQGETIEGEVVREPQALPPPREGQGPLTATDAELDDLFRQQPWVPDDVPEAPFFDGMSSPVSVAPTTTPYQAPVIQGSRPGAVTSRLYPSIEDRPQGFSLPENVFAVYRSPIVEVSSNLEIPSKGLKGSQFLKTLRDNPSVRAGEIATIQRAIQPDRRYTREELDKVVSENTWDVQAVNYGEQFQDYQRQMVRHDQIDYAVIAIDASNPNNSFQANNQHFGDNTLAHTRLSLRENELGRPYVLVEELQSDLTQQGWTPHEEVKSLSQFALDPDRIGSDYGVSMFDASLREGVPTARSIISTLFRNFDEELSKIQESMHSGRATSYKAQEQISELLRVSYPDLSVEELRNLSPYVRLTLQDYDISAANPAYSVIDPPVTTTLDSTRLAIEAAMAYAARNGADEVVIPPFERIVEARFRDNSEEYAKAITPGSGFHQTYVTSLERVLSEVSKEFGRDFSVRYVDLPYPDPSEALLTPSFLRTVKYDFDELSYFRGLPDYQERLNQTFENADGRQISYRDWYTQQYGPDFLEANTLDELLGMAVVEQALPPRPTEGLAINISNLRDRYDLEAPKFAEGGLVTQTKEAFYA